MEILNKKIEIKTAKLGKHKSFQHENLRTDGYDFLLFIDICPNYYYLTIVPKYNLKSYTFNSNFRHNMNKERD